MRLIDEDALMEECAKFVAPSNNSDFAEVPTWNDAISLIGSAQIIEERKTGKWIMHISDIYPADSTMECNVCHAEQPLWCDDNYCPNCGARMELEGN